MRLEINGKYINKYEMIEDIIDAELGYPYSLVIFECVRSYNDTLVIEAVTDILNNTIGAKNAKNKLSVSLVEDVIIDLCQRGYIKLV